jgi:hypothetical protein
MTLKSSPNLNYFFLTIRFHPNDVKIFEDYISQLLSLIEEDTYIWCIENDNTPDRHFHAVISNVIKDKHYKDRDKLKQLLLPRLKTYLKKVFNQTDVDPHARTKAMNLSDKLEDGFRNKSGEDKVGYCLKEFCIRQGGTITEEDKEKHKLIYLNQKTITEHKVKNYIEIKTLTLKTAFTYMYDYYISYSPPIKSIFSSMTYDGFNFDQISGNQKDNIRNSLKLTLHKQEKIELTKREILDTEQAIDNIHHRDIYEEHEDMITDLENLRDVYTYEKQTSIPIDLITKIIEKYNT